MGKRKNKNKFPENTKKIPKWIEVFSIAGVITITTVYILLLMLFIKGIVQDVQLLVYKNKATGTVTTAEFDGRYEVSNNESVVGSTAFKRIHYVITFDHAVAGFTEYEYKCKNSIESEKRIGDRFILLFDEKLSPVEIRESAVKVDNGILAIFVTINVVGAILCRKFKEDKKVGRITRWFYV